MDFELQDLFSIGLLIFLEGILSIDNALAIALIAKKLPKSQQQKALTYGIGGAIVFRILALALAGFLMKWVWVKYVGGAYLIYMALSHWMRNKSHSSVQAPASVGGFWKAVLLIELTDIAFAVDSILAAVAVSPKLWVVITGGLMGLIMMRFAATFFIKLLNHYPKFEETAYILVFSVGLKLIIDALKLPGINFHSPQNPAFWAFWLVAVASILYGFTKGKKSDAAEDISALKSEEKAIDKFEGRS